MKCYIKNDYNVPIKKLFEPRRSSELPRGVRLHRAAHSFVAVSELCCPAVFGQLLHLSSQPLPGFSPEPATHFNNECCELRPRVSDSPCGKLLKI